MFYIVAKTHVDETKMFLSELQLIIRSNHSLRTIHWPLPNTMQMKQIHFSLGYIACPLKLFLPHPQLDETKMFFEWFTLIVRSNLYPLQWPPPNANETEMFLSG